MRSYRLPLARLVLATLVAACLAACNTVEGAGKDLQKAGEKIEGAAKRATQ